MGHGREFCRGSHSFGGSYRGISGVLVFHRLGVLLSEVEPGGAVGARIPLQRRILKQQLHIYIIVFGPGTATG